MEESLQQIDICTIIYKKFFILKIGVNVLCSFTDIFKKICLKLFIFEQEKI